MTLLREPTRSCRGLGLRVWLAYTTIAHDINWIIFDPDHRANGQPETCDWQGANSVPYPTTATLSTLRLSVIFNLSHGLSKICGRVATREFAMSSFQQHCRKERNKFDRSEDNHTSCTSPFPLLTRRITIVYYAEPAQKSTQNTSVFKGVSTWQHVLQY